MIPEDIVSQLSEAGLSSEELEAVGEAIQESPSDLPTLQVDSPLEPGQKYAIPSEMTWAHLRALAAETKLRTDLERSGRTIDGSTDTEGYFPLSASGGRFVSHPRAAKDERGAAKGFATPVGKTDLATLIRGMFGEDALDANSRIEFDRDDALKSDLYASIKSVVHTHPSHRPNPSSDDVNAVGVTAREHGYGSTFVFSSQRPLLKGLQFRIEGEIGLRASDGSIQVYPIDGTSKKGWLKVGKPRSPEEATAKARSKETR